MDSKPLIYAGIGSRKTPYEICEKMVQIAEELAPYWLLRTGHAERADNAFEVGANKGKGDFQSFLPWEGFNNAPKDDPRFIVPDFRHAALNIAELNHPNWRACSHAVQRLHTRNVYQVLGLDLSTPAKMVICWTEGGLGQGGTGQAIRIANRRGIPVFDLAIEGKLEELVDFVITEERKL